MSDLPVDNLLTVDQATALIDGLAVRPRQEVISLSSAARRRLAVAVNSPFDFPRFDRSLLDGFAIHFADVKPDATFPLTAAGAQTTGLAGQPPSTLAPGHAQQIMTGAPLPYSVVGDLCVVPVEQTQITAGRLVLTAAGALRPNSGIAKRASDFVAGREVLPAGTVLTPQSIAAIAACGHATLAVFKRPRIALVTTGNEVTAPGQALAPAAVYDASTAMLSALLTAMGCEVISATHAADEPAAHTGELRQAAAKADVLFITGGVSMGTHDFVPAALESLGFNLLIRKVRMRPGKPFVLGHREADGGAHVAVGLPGNPVSGLVCTTILAGRLLSRLAGGPADHLSVTRATLTAPTTVAGPRTYFQPAILSGSNVTPLDLASSADVFTLARANALILRPAGDGLRACGDPVTVFSLPE